MFDDDGIHDFGRLRRGRHQLRRRPPEGIVVEGAGKPAGGADLTTDHTADLADVVADEVGCVAVRTVNHGAIDPDLLGESNITGEVVNDLETIGDGSQFLPWRCLDPVIDR
jgi:hypothetical protein